jgi:hypothetical protein
MEAKEAISGIDWMLCVRVAHVFSFCVKAGGFPGVLLCAPVVWNSMLVGITLGMRHTRNSEKHWLQQSQQGEISNKELIANVN